MKWGVKSVEDGLVRLFRDYTGHTDFLLRENSHMPLPFVWLTVLLSIPDNGLHG